MLSYQSIKDIDLAEKTLVLRVDFNCPVVANHEQTVLKDTKRIDDHIRTTLVPLFNQGNPPRNMVLLAHQGRHGHGDCTTLRAHFEHCRSALQPERIKIFYMWEELKDEEVLELGEAALASTEILERIKRLRDRTVLLLENVRITEHEETAKGKVPADFADNPLIKMLASLDNCVFALDGFSVAHRPQPSVVGLAQLGDLYAGPVVMREIEQLSNALQNPERPLLLIVGGAKVDDSLNSIERFLANGMAGEVLTGGLVGLTFLLAEGANLNRATMDNIANATSDVDTAVKRAQNLQGKYGSEQIRIPVDVAYAPKQALANQRQTVPVSELGRKNFKPEIGDIGIGTIARYIGQIARARTIVMNGPMGRYEYQCFARGTEEVLRYAALVAHERGALALLGGGDTGAALGALAQADAVHVKECSSGKAFLQVLASGDVGSLAGIRALARKGVSQAVS